MKNNPLPRLEEDEELKQKLLPFCRLNPGEIWIDPVSNHKVRTLCSPPTRGVAKKEEGVSRRLNDGTN